MIDLGSTEDDGKAIIDRIVRDAETRGWSAIGTEDEHGTGYLYTVGAWHTLGLPELVTTGLPYRTAGRLTAAAIDLGRKVGGIEAGARISGILRGLDLRLRRPDDREEARRLTAMLGIYSALVGDDIDEVPILQIEWTDEENRFPGEPGFIDHGQRLL